MNFYADSNYIHAKIYALRSLLLARRDYYDIAKNFNFKMVLPGLDLDDLKKNSSAVKEKLFENQVSVVMALAGASESAQWIFILFLRYFELLNLRFLCAESFGHFSAPSIWYNLGGYASLQRECSAGGSGIDTVIGCTRSTWMRDVFGSGGVESYEDAERLVDDAVLRLALDFVNSLKPSDRKTGRELVSGIAAYLSLSWQARLRHVYGMEQAEVFDYTGSAFPYHKPGLLLKRSVEKWELKLMKQAGGDFSRGVEGLTAAERTMERNIMRYVRRMFHADFHSSNTAACYLVLLHRQIVNLFSVVDGLRFGIPAEMIMENIICEE